MTPRLIAALVAAAVVLAAVLGLYWKGRLEGAAREQPKLEAARAQAKVADLEARGARDTAERAAAVAKQREAVGEAVNDLTREALKTEDANAPLDPARVERLRRLDERLCDTTGFAGCATDPDTSGGPADV